jgi:KDO2-lipid IV(A) lauroyltransferase
VDNIERVYGDRASPTEKISLMKAFYSHVASVLKDIILMGWLPRHYLQKQVKLRGVEHLLAAVAKERGVLILTGHFGSWELGPIGFNKMPQIASQIHIIRRPIRKKRLENMLFKRFDRWGIKRIISNNNALLKVNQALKRKEIVLFALDQHTEVTSKLGLAVDFFGEKAGTYSSLAFFAQKFQAPVIPLSGYREKDCKLVMEFHPSLPWKNNADKELALYDNTLLYNQTLENMILAHPDQWWWVHRRWKL